MKVNAKRLWERLQEVGSIGADPRGGISRFAWTPEYRQACELLMQWMREAGLTVRMDTVGNIFGRLEGKTSKPAILSGSHFDTVPCGGKFDGLAGIMTALEALTTLRENGFTPERPIEMVAFVNEEASQFLGGTFGSKAMCGVLSDNYPWECKHRYTGQTLHQAMLDFGMGLDPDNFAGSRIDPKDYCCFIELHIEQGRYLLDHDIPMAVITDIAGIKQFYITLNGVSCHAGGMAMEDRHDTLAAAAAIACEVERLAKTISVNARGTVGYIDSDPGEHNIIARMSTVPVDYREVDDECWIRFYDDLIAFVEKECANRGLTYSIKTTIDLKPSHCDKRIMESMHKASDEHGIYHTEMISFPCHDAVNLERIMPMGMIFLRSSNEGLSHCPEEYTTPEDLEAGANALLGTFIDLAQSDVF